MAVRVICVSHSTGAGGREVARAVASRLGYRCLDEEIVTSAAERAGEDPEVVGDVERRRGLLARILEELEPVAASAAISPGGFAFPDAFYLGEPEEPPPTSREGYRQLIREAITEVAQGGEVVIASHAASMALTERDDVLRVLVTASPEVRTRRLMEARGLDEAVAAKAIREEDLGRSAYLRSFYGVSRELPTHYDLVVNTDRIRVEQAVDLVLAAAG